MATTIGIGHNKVSLRNGSPVEGIDFSLKNCGEVVISGNGHFSLKDKELVVLLAEQLMEYAEAL